MDVLKVLLFGCLIGIANSHSTSSEIDVLKGPCSGIEFRTKFNVFSFFVNVEDEIYCVGSDGNMVDYELACLQRQSGMLGFHKYRLHILQ